MGKINFDYNGVEFIVEGEYEEKCYGTEFAPHVDGYFNVYAIYWRNMNVNQLFEKPELHIKEEGETLMFGKHDVTELYFLLDIKDPWNDFCEEIQQIYSLY